jgi:hypothetical protein
VLIVVIAMVGHYENTIILREIFQCHAFHLQIILASMPNKGGQSSGDGAKSLVAMSHTKAAIFSVLAL